MCMSNADCAKDSWIWPGQDLRLDSSNIREFQAGSLSSRGSIFSNMSNMRRSVANPLVASEESTPAGEAVAHAASSIAADLLQTFQRWPLRSVPCRRGGAETTGLLVAVSDHGRFWRCHQRWLAVQSHINWHWNGKIIYTWVLFHTVPLSLPEGKGKSSEIYRKPMGFPHFQWPELTLVLALQVHLIIMMAGILETGAVQRLVAHQEQRMLVLLPIGTGISGWATDTAEEWTVFSHLAAGQTYGSWPKTEVVCDVCLADEPWNFRVNCWFRLAICVGLIMSYQRDSWRENMCLVSMDLLEISVIHQQEATIVGLAALHWFGLAIPSPYWTDPRLNHGL